MSTSKSKRPPPLSAEDVAQVINGQPASGIVIFPNGIEAPIPAGFTIPAYRIVHVSRKPVKKSAGPTVQNSEGLPDTLGTRFFLPCGKTRF